MTAIEHLYEECKILPMRHHLRLKTTQFQTARRLNHRGRSQPVNQNPPRLVKQISKSRYQHYVDELGDTDDFDPTDEYPTLSEDNFKRIIRTLHINQVQD